ncbi:MAG: restriction endonuclease subunit S [bacterium]|nr:restriction endonuclease subunit S [bacterium]
MFSAKAPKENMFDISGLSYISEKQHIRNPRTSLQENDVIISTVGTIGNCAVITEDLLPANSDRHVGIIRSKEISPYLISTFLLSKYGRMQSLRNVVGNVQPNLYIRDMKKFIFPYFPHSFQLQIERMVKEAHEKQTLSKQLYKEAEELLLKELDLINYKPKHKLTFETTKKEVEQAKRFDSEYFQPKYDDIIKKIEEYEGGWDYVRNIFKFNKKNFFPKDNELYSYIPLSKVSNNGEIEIPEKELGKNLPTRARRKVKTGEVILSSISGSLETSALINEEHENFIVSNGFYVFKSNKINSETLLVIFKSKFLLIILQRISKGAILGGYDLTAFESCKIPIISQPIQTQISEKIQQSHKLRKESKELLELAKQKVEQEIENESKKYIKNKETF